MGGEVVVERRVYPHVIIYVYGRGLGQTVRRRADDVVQCRLNVSPQGG